MQDRDGDPEDAEREESDHAAECVCEDHAPAGTAAFRRAGEAFVKHFVQAVHDGADADDQIAKTAVLSLLVRRVCRAAGAATAVGGRFRRLLVAVCDDQDAEDGEPDGEHLVEAQFVVQEHDAEDVCEEGRAVVDRG